jgi:apolipoprotein N-acyltransferase
VARRDNLYEQVLLSRAPGWEKATHVIWSETAATWPVDRAEDGVVRNLVAQAVPPGGWLITGAPRQSPQGAPLRIWNSVVALSAAGEIAAIYDKAHLVPFGEYVPFAGVLPVAKLTHGRVDFSAGPGLETERLPRTPAYSPLVCYEVIFPGAVVAADRPDWLLNVTNDAWFGLSAGPHQHFASAVLRSVEEGLPLVRAANTGISAVVDPYGRVVARLDLGRRGVLDAPLPLPLPPTWFARWGNLTALAAAALALFVGLALANRPTLPKLDPGS